mmetsp:Transcript_105320/g.209328  ORF Transcript_105320/g.209328 Transcript_105320/m.209328 type:complete len:80 (-) Transcript_105320:35-274(-)
MRGYAKMVVLSDFGISNGKSCDSLRGKVYAEIHNSHHAGPALWMRQQLPLYMTFHGVFGLHESKHRIRPVVGTLSTSLM